MSIEAAEVTIIEGCHKGKIWIYSTNEHLWIDLEDIGLLSKHEEASWGEYCCIGEHVYLMCGKSVEMDVTPSSRPTDKSFTLLASFKIAEHLTIDVWDTHIKLPRIFQPDWLFM